MEQTTATQSAAIQAAQSFTGRYPPLETVSKPHLTTAELAYYSNLAEQTWRIKACRGTGQLQPLRIPGSNLLRWPTDEVRKFLGLTS